MHYTKTRQPCDRREERFHAIIKQQLYRTVLYQFLYIQALFIIYIKKPEALKPILDERYISVIHYHFNMISI